MTTSAEQHSPFLMEAKRALSLPSLKQQEEDRDSHLHYSERSKRLIKPTWKVKENLETARSERFTHTALLWQRVQKQVTVLSAPGAHELPPEGALEQLYSAYQSYKEICKKYSSTLLRANTSESQKELQDFQQLNAERDRTVRDIVSETEAKMVQMSGAASYKSRSIKSSRHSLKSGSSRYSTLSDQLIKARTEAETTKVHAIFAQREAEVKAESAHKEAEMKAESARTEAEIEALQKECEHVAAMARLKVFEQALGGSQEGSASLCDLDTEDSLKRTRDYVLSQVDELPTTTNIPISANTSPEPQDTDPPTASSLPGQSNAPQTFKPEPASYSNAQPHPAHQQPPYAHVYMQPNMPARRYTPNNYVVPAPYTTEIVHTKPITGLNAYATPYFPMFPNQEATNHATSTTQSANVPPTSERLDMSDFARYMIRRELTNTGLTKFVDQPENYRGWKCAFKTATRDLGITAAEELDLLIRWLGPRSTERIKRLRSVYISDPTTGLATAWDRLEKGFGSPEAIEDALLKQLYDLPKISGKDASKYQELSDLLSELQLAKTDTHLPGLSYLDTARGVKPIVAKLPYNVQERWTMVGTNYKKEHQVCFPPFSYFCEFINGIAERKADPSFTCGEPTDSTSPAPRYESPHQNDRKRRGPVSVKKTDVLPPTPSAPDNGTEGGKAENPNRQCPIHKLPHPLKKCIGFRKKPLQERKELLKRFGVCFRCCSSTEHLAKDCKVTIKCMECDSTDHVQALHPSQPDPAPTPSPTTSHGGESIGQAANHLTVSSCTAVCGEDLWDKSCAKICLVRVYPKGHPERAVKVYSILDDQSNRSLARSELFDLFGLKGNAYPYTLGTCSGISEACGRRASGLVVTSLENTVEIPLPTLVECNQIPANREEIPTPEAALHHPHLRTIASKIPPLDHSAKILILIGRDILQLHKVRQHINGPHDAPFAQRYDLGWVIIGNICVGKMKSPDAISSYKTHVLPNGRGTHFQPCPHHYGVKERLSDSRWRQQPPDCADAYHLWDDDFGSTAFEFTNEDNKLAPMREDKELIKIMDKEFSQNDSNSWVAPLPFRSPRPRLPNNSQ
ncbi:uncharacterized protein ACNLHF_019812 [Anomaloglossus baeobatrachus]